MSTLAACYRRIATSQEYPNQEPIADLEVALAAGVLHSPWPGRAVDTSDDFRDHVVADVPSGA